MKTVAPGVERFDQFPMPIMNVYLADGVMFDAASSWDRRRIGRQLRNTPLTMVTLTHVHPDHQGLARDICLGRGIPLACHAEDVDAMEGTRPVSGEQTMNPIVAKLQASWEGPPHKVDTILNEGDEVAGFKVIHTPGHARGHVVYWRESDGTVICGDIIRNINYFTGKTELGQPPDAFTYDPAENRRSIRKVAELNPTVLLPGHGPAVTDIAGFEKFVEALPQD